MGLICSHRVFTPVGKSDLGKLALDVATKALDYYAEFFGVKYWFVVSGRHSNTIGLIVVVLSVSLRWT